MTPGRRRGVLWQMHPLRWLSIDLRHPRCAVLMTSTGPSIPWRCPSMIYAVFLCDTAPCSLIFGRVSWQQTWPKHDSLDAWRLTVKGPDVQRRYRPVVIHINLLYVLCSLWYAKHPPVAFVFKSLDSPLQIRQIRRASQNICPGPFIWYRSANSLPFLIAICILTASFWWHL